MSTSREIKKALTKAFKGVKFTTKTRNVLCETVTISWTGGPFINQVKEITDAWHTYQDHSDIMTDYFHYTGTEIQLNRELSQDEIDFVVPDIFSLNGRIIDDLEIVFNPNTQSFIVPKDPYGYRLTKHNESLNAYSKNGMAIELDSHEAEKAKDDYLRTTNAEAWTIKHEQEKQAKKDEELAKHKEIESRLIQGNYTGSPANYNLDYIVIHWHEGVQTIAEDAKFSSFKSANEAIRKIYSHENMIWGYMGYDKLKFSIHFTDGEVYADGMLYLSPTDDNPFTTDNVIGEHCVNFLKEQSSKNNLEAKSILEIYRFDDIEPMKTPEMFLPLEVDEPYEPYELVANIEFQAPPLEVDEPKIKTPNYVVIKDTKFNPVPVPCPAVIQSTFKVIKTSPLVKSITWGKVN